MVHALHTDVLICNLCNLQCTRAIRCSIHSVWEVFLHGEWFVPSLVGFLCLARVFSQSHPHWHAHMPPFSHACLCHMHTDAVVHTCPLSLSLSLSFCASLSWLLCAVSWFHSFQSVCLATGIFADVSVLQPQPLRERERDALEAEGDKREETITLRLTLPPWPRPEVWDLDVRICAFKSLHGCAFPELSIPPYVRARLSRSQ